MDKKLTIFKDHVNKIYIFINLLSFIKSNSLEQVLFRFGKF